MASHEIILLIALSVTLATWGIAQAIVSLIHGDRHKLQNRLARDWRGDAQDILSPSVTLCHDLKGDKLPPYGTI